MVPGIAYLGIVPHTYGGSVPYVWQLIDNDVKPRPPQSWLQNIRVETAQLPVVLYLANSRIIRIIRIFRVIRVIRSNPQ